MKKRLTENQEGISLLEVLVAMLILSLALLMLLNMGVIAMDNNDWANKTTVATQALQEKLEEIRASNNFSSGSDTSGGDVIRSWSCDQISTHLQEVTVTATWTGYRGEDHVSSVSAYVRTD